MFDMWIPISLLLPTTLLSHDFVAMRSVYQQAFWWGWVQRNAPFGMSVLLHRLYVMLHIRDPRRCWQENV